MERPAAEARTDTDTRAGACEGRLAVSRPEFIVMGASTIRFYREHLAELQWLNRLHTPAGLMALFKQPIVRRNPSGTMTPSQHRRGST